MYVLHMNMLYTCTNYVYSTKKNTVQLSIFFMNDVHNQFKDVNNFIMYNY